MKKGIDISKWQEEVDFAKVKSQVDFVILREGYRKTIDPYFLQYVNGCNKNGIPIVGVYHFCYATSNADAREEAKSCIANIEKAGLGKDVIVFFDFEYDTVEKAKDKGVILGKNECILFTNTFCDYVRSQGYTAGVYANLDYYKNMYDKATIDKYVFWLADYTGEPDVNCAIQQTKSSGRVSGINGNVDMDILFDDKLPTNDQGEKNEGTGFQSEIEKIYAVMQEEVGYLEKQTNAYLDDKTANAGYNNYTKYWRDSRKEGMMSYYGYGPSTNFAGGPDWPYCADGIFWSFMKALGVNRAQKLLLHSGAAFINCETMYQKAVAAGRIISKPKPGCLVLFYNASGHYHVEFCYAMDSKIEYTIGFNTSGASQVIANGGGVCDKRYVIATTKAHYFMPLYTSEKAEIPPTPSASVTYLKYGSKGSAVKDMQTKLIAVGYSCGSCGADGDFGSGTLAAVRAFQGDKGLEMDGIYGEKTAEALNTAYASRKEKNTVKPSESPVLFVGKVNRENVDVRTWAGREYGNIKSWPKLGKGNLVDVLDYTQKDTEGENWYYVRIAGKYHGFVIKKNIDKA